MPERGVLLEYEFTISAREAVERRLARAQLQARVSEDEHLLTLRLSEATDAADVKALLAFPGTFELCGEQLDDEAHWCGLVLPAGVERQALGRGCVLRGPLEAALRAAVPPSIGRPVVMLEQGTFTLISAADCVTPHLVAGEVRDTALALTWDSASAAKVGTLTRALVANQTRLVVLGPEVLALELHQPLTGTHLSVPTNGPSARARHLLLAALLAGPLPPLVLRREGTWGPPRLR
jgi:hypothetical protein